MTLDQLREKAEHATPGPWVLDTEECSVVVWRGDLPMFVVETWEHQDAVFVAAFNPQVALAFVEYVQANEQRIALLSMARPDIESLRDALLRFEAARARLFGLLGEAT